MMIWQFNKTEIPEENNKIDQHEHEVQQQEQEQKNNNRSNSNRNSNSNSINNKNNNENNITIRTMKEPCQGRKILTLLKVDCEVLRSDETVREVLKKI